jgi:hypothetical protein
MPVARAKRTDRAEARRKYRAYLQAQQEEETARAEDSESPAGADGSKPARGRDARSTSAVPPTGRLGFGAAARAAYRTPHYIDDIRNIGPLILRSNAVWPVLVVCAVAGAYSAVRINSGKYDGDPILSLVVQFLFLPVPLAPPMLAGFLAPRSSWLAGMIAGFIATITLGVILAFSTSSLSQTTGTIAGLEATPTPSGQAATGSSSAAASAVATPTLVPSATAASTDTSAASATPAAASSPSASPAPSSAASPSASASPGNGSTGSSDTTSDLLPVMIALLPQSVAFGALVGAVTAWYKRFLSYTSGAPRKAPPSKSGGQRSSQRRPATRR